jgi:DNA polymerase-1
MISSSGGIAVTIDKDLRTVPGWHWNPDKEEEPVYVEKEDADVFFYLQWMTGDTTDNIPGLWRVGPKKAEKFLANTPRSEWEEQILELYKNEKRPETKQVDMSPEDFALAMARCVRILRNGEYDKDNKEVILWNPMIG